MGQAKRRIKVGLTVAAVALAALVVSESNGMAQSRRTTTQGSSVAQRVRRGAAVPGTQPNSNQNQGQTVNGHAPNVPSSDPIFGGFYIGPSGMNIGGPFGSTVDRVHGGVYVPGFGVNMGFAAPEQVYGGWFVPGYGVNNGFATPAPVYGGSFMPGFGVISSGAFNNGGGGQVVNGGTFMPGFGVIGPVGGGFNSGAAVSGFSGGGQAVTGGTFVPGFGVTGAR